MAVLGQAGVEVEWIKSVINAGGFGVLAWVILYVFRTLIPRLLDQFSADLKVQREAFSADLKLIHEQLREEMSREREARREMAEGLKASVSRMADSCSMASGHHREHLSNPGPGKARM